MIVPVVTVVTGVVVVGGPVGSVVAPPGWVVLPPGFGPVEPFFFFVAGAQPVGEVADDVTVSGVVVVVPGVVVPGVVVDPHGPVNEWAPMYCTP